MLICLLVFTVFYVKSYALFRLSTPATEEMLLDWLREHSLCRPLRIRWSDRVKTPLTYGVLCPVILLPKGMDLSRSKRVRFILMHEYTHIRHFDALAKILCAAALSLYWFNPAVWLMWKYFNRDMELACDEGVVEHF